MRRLSSWCAPILCLGLAMTPTAYANEAARQPLSIAMSQSDSRTPVLWVAKQPVTRCVLQSAKKYRLDPYLIWAIKQVETGNSMDPKITGNNTNGTRDLGLMQINDGVWLKELAKFDIQALDLYDACTNIDVGAWILANSIKRHGVKEGIGRYHSATPKYKNVYISKVYAKWQALLKKAYSM